MIENLSYKEHLRKLLLDKALLANKCLSGHLSINDFQDGYGDFFYYEALDGHEADELQIAVLEEFATVIEFHQYVQNEIVDKVYTETNEVPESYIKAGRISKLEAIQRLKICCGKYKPYVYQLNI